MNRRLEIVILSHEPFWPPSGGGSTEAAYLVQAFIERGHKPIVFAPGKSECLPLWAFKAQEEGNFEFFPFQYVQIKRLSRLRFLYYPIYPFLLYRHCSICMERRKTPDLILIQHAISALVGGWLKKKWNCQLILNELDFLAGYFDVWPRYLIPTSLARFFKKLELRLPFIIRADGILVVSDALRERFIKAGVSPDHICTIYYGYDPEKFKFNENSNYDPYLIVMHGSFDRHHIGKLASDAIMDILKIETRSRIRFIGKRTVALNRLINMCKQQGYDSRVQVIDFVPYEEIASKIKEASIGIVPYEASEGGHCAFVAKAVEYLALGMPVVSSKLEGLWKFFKANPLIRFTDFNAKEFAKTVIWTLKEAPLIRQRYGSVVARQLQEELSWQAVAERAIQFIEKISFHNTYE